MGYAFAQPIRVEFVVVRCFKCDIPFWVPETWDKERLAKRDTWFCPNGHQQHYVGETEADRLRKMLAAANTRNTDLTTRVQQEAEAKAKLERKLKRVQRGVCPHCNRSFQNLARHMCSKHGDEKGSA